MLLPGRLNLDIYRGDTIRFQCAAWNDKGKTDPTDLTDMTPIAEVRDKPGGALIATFVCTVELPNKINIAMDAAVSKTLKKGSWDLRVSRDTSGVTEVRTVAYGSVSIQDDTSQVPMVATARQRTRVVVVK